MIRIIKKIIIYTIFIIIIQLISENVYAITTNIYKSSTPSDICSDIISNKIKIGIHSFYNNNNTILNHTNNVCNNASYFTNNLSNKVKGEEYVSWTYFGQSRKDFSHFIEGIDVTNSEKYSYFYISNNFQSYNKNTNKLNQTNTLKAGEKIFFDIDISDQNILTGDYSDFRIIMNYSLNSSDISISLYNSIAYYIIDDNDNEYGPFKLEEAEYIKQIRYTKDSNNIVLDEYKLTSKNLFESIVSGKKIKKIRIVPYENYPVQSGMIRIYSIFINGYSDNYSNNKEYVSVKDASKKIRQNITNNMATNGTIKWGVNKELNFICSLCNNKRIFESDKIYYGLPYVNHIDATIYSFLSNTEYDTFKHLNRYNFATNYLNDEITSLNNTFLKGSETTNPLYVYEPNTSNKSSNRVQELSTNNYVENKPSNYFLGQDCSSSIFSAYGKELPYTDSMAGSSRYLTSAETIILGNIEIDYKDFEKYLRDNEIIASDKRMTPSIIRNKYTSYIHNKFTREKIYNGYGLLMPGDVVSKDGHTRLETGYTHVECNDGTITNNYKDNGCANHNGINGENSYIIITEVRGIHINMSESDNEKSTHVTQNQAGWIMTPDNNFTDITNIDELYESGNEKITSFRFNKKYTFAELYGLSESFDSDTGIELSDESMYLPYRYVAMNKIINTEKIEKPEIKLVLDKEYDSNERNTIIYNNLKNDHKLRGIIISNYMIEKIKIEINGIKYYIYPNQTNKFSLYNDLTDEKILNALDSLVYNNSNTIKVSVFSAPKISEIKDTILLDDEDYVEVYTITNLINYTISFNPNGGTGGQNENVIAKYGNAMPAISNNIPIKNGYIFMGWYDNEDYKVGTQYYNAQGISTKEYDKISDTILYAGWKLLKPETTKDENEIVEIVSTPITGLDYNYIPVVIVSIGVCILACILLLLLFLRKRKNNIIIKDLTNNNNQNLSNNSNSNVNNKVNNINNINTTANNDINSDDFKQS